MPMIFFDAENWNYEKSGKRRRRKMKKKSRRKEEDMRDSKDKKSL